MSELLTDILIADHHRISELANELTTECSRKEPSEGSCFNRFRTFKALVMSYSKAEDYTLYALIEENESRPFSALRRFVLEAYVKHDLIDLLLKELGQAEELTDSFRAKLTVLKDLLLNHLHEEEETFLPEISRRLSPEQLHDLAVVYTRERDTIFAKKSGLVKPALVTNPRDLLTH